jgi:nonsense-mediated mRNA decay protein 3
LSEEDIVRYFIGKDMDIRDLELSFSGDEYNRKVSYDGYFITEQGANHMSGVLFLSTSLASCPQCTLRRGNYFEAILQLRGGRDHNLDDVLEYAISQFKTTTKPGIFLTKTVKRKEGFDLFISEKQFTRNVGKKIIYKFGGTLIETSHLVGKKEGKDLYRITVSTRIPDFHIGDVIRVRGDDYLIQRIRENEVTLIDVKKEITAKMKLNDIKEHSVILKGEDILEAQVLYREGNTAYILDPYDFRERAIHDTKRRDSVYVAKIDDDLVLIPKD